MLQLILGRSHVPVAFPTDPTQQATLPQHSFLPGQLGPLVNLQTLQDDVLVTFLAGMPLIEQTSVFSMRTPFKFKDDSSPQFRWVWLWVWSLRAIVTVMCSSFSSLRDHTVDIDAIAEKLPESFKVTTLEYTLEPPIKDAPKEDKLLNEGQSKNTFVYTLHTKRGQPQDRRGRGLKCVHYFGDSTL